MPPLVLPEETAAPHVLKPGDQALLLGTLSALLEQLPGADVRVAAFNLEQQKELFRDEHFHLESLNDLALTLHQLQLATVDYKVLQNRNGHLDLLAGLINRELRGAPPADLVVFLGPRERFEESMPEALLDARRGAVPRFFFLAYQLPVAFRRSGPAPAADNPLPSIDPANASPQGGGGGGGRGLRRASDLDVSTPPRLPPDTVSLTVAKLKGKTIAIESPRQFAKAIKEIEQAASK